MPEPKPRPGVVITATPKFKPRRDRKVMTKAVPCPTCKAGTDRDCLSASGKKVQHRARRAMALRAERGE